jgi:ribosomal subunit interface protein|tara:strand:+ start:462 stop:905 length:444 start_codon:yes stop_codon:yes gene_type:complete
VKIVIKAKNIELNKFLRDFIEKKIGQLEKFSDIFREEYFDDYLTKRKPIVKAWVEISKTTLHHRKGPFFRAECQMRFPGKSMRSEALSHNLRLSIVEVKDELQRQIKKYKNKSAAKSKRAQRAIKKDLKLSPLARFYRKRRIKKENL